MYLRLIVWQSFMATLSLFYELLLGLCGKVILISLYMEYEVWCVKCKIQPKTSYVLSAFNASTSSSNALRILEASVAVFTLNWYGPGFPFKSNPRNETELPLEEGLNDVEIVMFYHKPISRDDGFTHQNDIPISSYSH
jgi:hypothetical protein